MRRILFLLSLTMCGLVACGAFPEATFELSPDSRLPRWFTVPDGMSRRDVTVTMSYYVKSTGRTATFDLLDSRKNKLAQLSGSMRGMEPTHLKPAAVGSPPGYPVYEVVEVNGTVDVIEHRRMEPTFYLVDDPAVWKELGIHTNSGSSGP